MFRSMRLLSRLSLLKDAVEPRHQKSWPTRDVQVSKTVPLTIPRAVLGTRRRGIIDVGAMFGVPGPGTLLRWHCNDTWLESQVTGGGGHVGGLAAARP